MTFISIKESIARSIKKGALYSFSRVKPFRAPFPQAGYFIGFVAFKMEKFGEWGSLCGWFYTGG